MKTLAIVVAAVLVSAAHSLSASASEFNYVSQTKVGDAPWFIMKVLATAVDNEKQNFAVDFIDGTDKSNLCHEDIVLDKDGLLKTFRFQQKQTHDDVEIDLVGDNVNFVKDGKNKTIKLDKGEGKIVVTPPLIAHYLTSHWAELKKGKEMDLKLIVPDREEVFSFYVKPGDDFDPNRESNTLTLKANNMFVGMVSGTIDFIFVKDGDKVITQRVNSLLPAIKFKGKNGKLEPRKTDVVLQK